MARPIRRKADDAHGLFASEREILDLWDKGLSATTIARTLGKRPANVDGVIERYGDVGMRDSGYDRAIILSTQRLAAAIAATGKVFT